LAGAEQFNQWTDKQAANRTEGIRPSAQAEQVGSDKLADHGAPNVLPKNTLRIVSRKRTSRPERAVPKGHLSLPVADHVGPEGLAQLGSMVEQGVAEHRKVIGLGQQ